MGIEKKALNTGNCYNPVSFHKNARSGLLLILKRLVQQGGYILLLPAYIGFSATEGSGIFDPVIESGIAYSFYGVDRFLQVDLDDLCKKMNNPGKTAVLIVHYFGVPDHKYEEIIQNCKDNNALIIEDCAHALFSDYVDHKCGEYGDYSFFSIHKMLPYSDGGMLSEKCKVNKIKSTDAEKRIFDFDLYQIALKRKKNACCWNKMVLSSCHYPDIIRPLYDFRSDVTYQTFPIIVENDKRDRLYFGLNERGYGAVSLYHEMIEPIKDMNYLDSIWLSNHILNLPVHQDIEDGEIEKMFYEMALILEKGDE